MFLPSLFLWILLAAQPAWSQTPYHYLFRTSGSGWTGGYSGCRVATRRVGNSLTLSVNAGSASIPIQIIGNIPNDPSIISATLDGQPFTIPSRPADAGPCGAILFAGDQLGKHLFKFTLKGPATGKGNDFFGFNMIHRVAITTSSVSNSTSTPTDSTGATPDMSESTGTPTDTITPNAFDSASTPTDSTIPSASNSADTLVAIATQSVSGGGGAFGTGATPSVPGSDGAIATGTTPSGSASNSAPPFNPKVGAIVGGTVGGIAGILAAIGAFLLAKSTLPWVSASLAAFLGLFAYRTRRLIFTADENIPESQFAFFLTSKSEFKRFERATLVWTVERIGNTQRKFELDVPCRIGHGLTRLCYGTIIDHDTHVTLDQWAEAPALFNVATGTWDKCPEEKGQPKVLFAKKVYTNPGDAASARETDDRIVLGTGEEEKGEMKPFLLISPEEFQSVNAGTSEEEKSFLRTSSEESQTEYKAGTDLYLHAFRVRNDCQSGQYGNKISQDVINDRITPEEGIHVKKLAPLTTWHFKQDSKGKLTIKVGENDKSDLKAFKHEFSMKKAEKKSNV